MRLSITDLNDRARIPDRFAFGVHDPVDHVRLSDNRNPGVEWRGAPSATQSFVLVCVDRAVPSRGDDVNRPDRTVPADLPRTDFYHWVMVDIPPACTRIGEGECSAGITPHGKHAPPGPPGARQGLNDYTGWFAGDPDMRGDYYGYDGPCPPWNDSIVHDYHFILYATDLARCPVDGAFTGAQVVAALDGHVLASAEVVGLYSINPSVRA